MSEKLVSLNNLSDFYDNLKSHDLAGKADANSVYSKSEITTLLESYPTATEVYTKEQVVDMLTELEQKIYTRLGVIPDQPYPSNE